MQKIYLDYAATTPVDKRVLSEMTPYFGVKFGNSMSLHSFGRAAKIALEESRAVLAGFINADLNEIIFTGSATESNNLALKGVALKNKEKKHIIISSIEHPCIVESSEWLKKQGFEITKIPVDKYGTVDTEYVRRAITKKTILVSVIHASNEIGTIQPIEKIGKICREAGVYFHTDASQSFGKILIDVKKMNIDLLTASSHKIYGPKGAALLYIRKGIMVEPVLHGGGQENGLRGSTVNIPAVVGFARAVDIYKKEAKKENARLIKLRNNLIRKVLKIEDSHLNGHPEKRLPNNANFWFDFIEGESLIMQLDMEGIACSTGSACSSFKLEPSHVLMATGLRPEQAHGSLRVSLGRQTTEKEINQLIKLLPKIIKKIREISPYGK
ncbi:MAG: cysteine desulfurase NifS [Candidatus Staskawiczbacteria bacterium RIFOXYD1_FULL_39_28]|uniref:cysteine desulfurase n=1 Tax=Candidatus Staskawiczbacteria bacterium RIFOXYC1_FULL_38_18 TaxID=1802229 RepID=A0A1G2JEW7_9BACT|nr:MAG: cysteine desulfurase NifS [Candidatus Staskawiczbacteria bacterium RIFOXYC1_FULL_38_18]OGZ90307.1 MAG: cysteine desulfurase NifS [Candidatus Staskawiczbacteria bacterium RIFOXYD1_FULL_39_28]